MIVMFIDFVLIFIVLGVMGLGVKLVKFVFDVFKGGIIFGVVLVVFLCVIKEGDFLNVFE